MEKGKEKDSHSAGRELFITRLLNAPQELVWEVFTKPEHIKNWWGPDGFSNSIDKMEVKPGGAWEFVMHGPDGTDYKNVDVFKEVVKYERIVFEHVNDPKHITTINFTPQGDKTLLTWHMLFESKEQLEQVVKTFKADEGLKQNIEKLNKYMAKMAAEGELMFTRILNAPRELVFKVWTDPKRLQQWWSPAGFTNPVCEVDLRPGGVIHIDMRGPDGTVYPMFGEYKEIVEPERLVFISGPMDEQSNKLFEILNTVTFEDLYGKTKMTLTTHLLRKTDGVEHYLQGAKIGWTQSLYRLETQVAASNHAPLVIERTYKAPVELVWKAISDIEEMKKWYFDLSEFKPEPGFEFEFTKIKEQIKYRHLFMVTDVITGKKLTYSWRYDGFEGSSFVTFELFAEGDKTRLKLSHAGLETFPASNPDLARGRFVEGWTHMIGTALKEFVEKD